MPFKKNKIERLGLEYVKKKNAVDRFSVFLTLFFVLNVIGFFAISCQPLINFFFFYMRFIK